SPAAAAAGAEPRRPYLSEPAAPVLSPGDEARKAASDLGSFFRSLSTSDRWAAGATAALLLMLALPWRWTRQDEEIIGFVPASPKNKKISVAGSLSSERVVPVPVLGACSGT